MGDLNFLGPIGGRACENRGSPSTMKKIRVPPSKCGKLEFLDLSRRSLCKCGRFAPRLLRLGGLSASVENLGLKVRHNEMHPCKCTRLPHSNWAHNRVQCCMLDHAPKLGIYALDMILYALRCFGCYGTVGMLEWVLHMPQGSRHVL
jgi:hypothetical protein